MHVKRTIFNRPPEGDLGRKQHPFQLIRLRTYQLIVELPNNLCNNGTVTQCFLKKFVLVPLILYVFLPSKKLIQDFKINTRILSEIVFCFFKFEKFKTRKKNADNSSLQHTPYCSSLPYYPFRISKKNTSLYFFITKNQ